MEIDHYFSQKITYQTPKSLISLILIICLSQVRMESEANDQQGFKRGSNLCSVIFAGVEIDVIKIIHLAHFLRHKMN